MKSIESPELLKTPSEKFARIISTLFVPPSFALIIFTFLSFHLEETFLNTCVLILVTLIFGFGLHIWLFLHFKKKGFIVDLDASIKEERTFPFLIATGFYLTGLLILIYFQINIISIAFWFCYISNTIIVVLVNRYWKISIHAIGASGAAAALFIVLGPFALLVLILVLLVGWSRVKLRCHTPMQVIAGIVFGFCSTYLQIHFIVNWFSHAG